MTGDAPYAGSAQFVLISVGAAILGPVEMYCFYLFGNNGLFHYDGFGFGSLVSCDMLTTHLLRVECMGYELQR